MEMWGGVECTVNRVGDRRFDQIARSGHASRLDDIDRFADLGLAALRFPLLWDHVQPERHGDPDWRWADRALERLRERGVRPIVGLLHHGFGPPWIDARDPEFAHRFARYARQVAERYPWIDAYTPINEPLTTARFSGLYGHWHPHARDDRTFVDLFFAQLNATARAMREIRAVNPGAQLVQTEDLGKVSSTLALEPQRDFENARRWLTWDVLSGTLTRDHECWSYLHAARPAIERDLEHFADGASAPNVIGINHYVTSERHLDESVERYSLDEIGGNGREVYADVAQVQVPSLVRAGIGGLLRESWERYRRPMAITECHIGCTREEQMRWLNETWQAGLRARRHGIDLRAVTSWALLGSYDWNSLVTREAGHYEPGAFDVRGPYPRATALAAMVQALAHEGTFEHPVLATQGWWRRGGAHPGVSRPILIVADSAGSGRALVRACVSRGLAYVLSDCDELDIHSPSAVSYVLDARRPWAVVIATGYAAALADESQHRGLPIVSHSPNGIDAGATLDLLLDDSSMPAELAGRNGAVG